MVWRISLWPWHICRSHPVYDGSIVPSPGGGNHIDDCETAESHKRASIFSYCLCQCGDQVIVRVAKVKASRNLTARLVRDQSKEPPRKLRVASYSGWGGARLWTHWSRLTLLRESILQRMENLSVSHAPMAGVDDGYNFT